MAATAEAELVNSALVKIGVTQRIMSLDESSKSARAARTLYDELRKALLREYRWNFAMTRAEIPRDPEADPPFGFGAAYPVPADLLLLVGLYDEAEPLQNYTSTNEPYKVEGQHILVRTGNEDPNGPLRIFYIRDVQNVGEFDPSFKHAFTWRLAMELAYPLVQSRPNAERAAAMYEEAMRKARLSDAIEGLPEIQVISGWVDSRQQYAGALQRNRRYPNG